MKLTQIASNFAALLACAQAFKLYTESFDSSVDNEGLTEARDGALLIGYGASDYTYDEASKLLIKPASKYSSKYTFAIEENVALFSDKFSDLVTFEEGDYLNYNGSNTGFYACKNVDSSYYDRNYLTYFGSSTPTFDDCKVVKVKKVEVTA